MSLFGSWWVMVSHLAWSLLDVSGESDPMASVDVPSEHFARILYAAFRIFAVILLLNMLIALLSNTYQRTEVRGDMSTQPFTVFLCGSYNSVHSFNYSLSCTRITQLMNVFLFWWPSLTLQLLQIQPQGLSAYTTAILLHLKSYIVA